MAVAFLTMHVLMCRTSATRTSSNFLPHSLQGHGISLPLHPCITKTAMAKVCQLTGRRPQVGNNVSHANNKTKRRFLPNLQRKKFYLESEGVFVDLKVSAAGIRIINRIGLEAALKKAALKGTLN